MLLWDIIMISSEKPRWIPVSQMVSAGTIGYFLVAQIPDLGGRLRPETTFNQPLHSFWRARPVAPTTINDVLALPSDQRLPFPGSADILKHLRSYIERLSITPHARLLSTVCGGDEQYPVPSEREQEVIEAVEKQVDTLTQERLKILIRLSYGLEDGISRKHEQCGTGFSPAISKARVGQLERKALKMLRQPTRYPYLKGYRSLPVASFGRIVFGAVFEKDLPVLETELDFGVPTRSLQELVWLDLKKFPLAERTRNRIVEALQRVAVEIGVRELTASLTAEEIRELLIRRGVKIGNLDPSDPGMLNLIRSVDPLSQQEVVLY